jgi:RimJ/RimL family protein N-acetyltransferase
MAANQDFIVREADPADAAAVIAAAQAVLNEPGVMVLTSPGEFHPTLAEEEKVLTDHAAAANSVVLIAVAGDEVIGILTCTGGRRRGTRHTAMLGMSVRREWRDRGVGSALMAHAVEWARGTGVVTRIELDVYVENARARHLYEKFGFVVEGRRRRAIFRDGQYHDDLIMGLLL